MSLQGSGDSHGRNAAAPQEIPLSGWKDVLTRTFGEIGDDRVTLIAAAVTYYLLLALFPTLTAFVSIYGLFVDRATVAEHLSLLSAVVPEGGMAIVNEQLVGLTAKSETTLGVALLISIGIALWSASSGVKTMFEAMNVAYDEREKRNFFRLNAVALLFTLGGVVGATLMIGAAVLVPAILAMIGLGTGFEWILRIGSYVVLAIVLMLGLATLYRFGPSRQQAKWRWVSPGALLATLIILIVSLLFSWYTANFGNYDKTYGSLGGLLALLTWIWISVTAIIVGGELNSEAERQTRRDSTVGADSPMGQRNAVAADTVGGTMDDSEFGKPTARSADWEAGYRAAQVRYALPRQTSMPAWIIALPVVLAIGALKSRRRI